MKEKHLDAVVLAEFPPGSKVKIPRSSKAIGIGCHRKRNCIALPMTRVLLVEDSSDVLYVLQLELESMGYEIDAAPDAAAAIDAAVRVRPDIIISDLGMPDVDGFEFIRRVRSIPDLASVPAIALTGSTGDRNVEQALAFGFSAHVVKPVEIADLVKKIEQLTSRRLRRKAG